MIKHKLVIPARLDSTRLPRKPLLDVNGTPMVVRVAQNCIKALGKSKVIVSTPDDEIFEMCIKNDITCIRSSSNCRSGTDRLYEFIRAEDLDVIINVQGDEPLLTSDIISFFSNTVIKNPQTSIGVYEIESEIAINSKNTVKISRNKDRLIYASRFPIPGTLNKDRRIYYQHSGIYAFTKKDIRLFGESTSGILEKLENIEIMRALELNIDVQVVDIENYGRAVDTLDDLNWVREFLARKS